MTGNASRDWNAYSDWQRFKWLSTLQVTDNASSDWQHFKWLATLQVTGNAFSDWQRFKWITHLKWMTTLQVTDKDNASSDWQGKRFKWLTTLIVTENASSDWQSFKWLTHFKWLTTLEVTDNVLSNPTLKNRMSYSLTLPLTPLPEQQSKRYQCFSILKFWMLNYGHFLEIINFPI